MTIKPIVDDYLLQGCMRCKYGATPSCKVNTWRSELVALRSILLGAGLEETIKWGVPVYMHQNKNVLMLHALRGFAFVNFFKGSLLTDPRRVLIQVGTHQADRSIRFTDISEVQKLTSVLVEYIQEAIQLEVQGKKVVLKKIIEPMPTELLAEFEVDDFFQKQFYALTPSKQRGYIIYFSQPKQKETRIKRIQACKAAIAEGIGMNEKYRKRANEK